MAVTPAFPYSINPNSYAQQALTPQATTPPVQAQATPAMRGPANQALYDQLHGALQQQNAVPGLLAQMQANPAMAQQVGGLLAANPSGGIPLASNFYRLNPLSPNGGPAPAAQAPAAGQQGASQQLPATTQVDPASAAAQIAALQAQIDALKAAAQSNNPLPVG